MSKKYHHVSLLLCLTYAAAGAASYRVAPTALETFHQNHSSSSTSASATYVSPQCNVSAVDATELLTTLYDHLFSTYRKPVPYNRHIRPRHGENTNVMVRLFPLRLLHVDDSMGRVQVDLLIHLEWQDSRLAWRHHLHADDGAGGSNCTVQDQIALLRFVPVHDGEIWIPPFELAESVLKSNHQVGLLLHAVTVAEVDENGSVFLAARYAGELMCVMSLRKFPFDEQKCNATAVGSYVTYNNVDTDDVEVLLYEDDLEHLLAYYKSYIFEMNVFGPNMGTSTWSINPNNASLYATLAQPIKYETLRTTSVTYQFVLRRTPWPHIWSWLVPPIILSQMSVASMFLTCPTEERFSFGSQTIVTLILLITNLNEKLVPGRDGQPLLMWLYTGLFFNLIGATCISTVPQLYCHYRKRLKRKVCPARDPFSVAAVTTSEMTFSSQPAEGSSSPKKKVRSVSEDFLYCKQPSWARRPIIKFLDYFEYTSEAKLNVLLAFIMVFMQWCLLLYVVVEWCSG